MEQSEDDGIPTELKDRLSGFDTAISHLESTLQPLLSTSHTDLVEKLGPLDAAKLDLVGAYSINSLFWMYLNVCGVNPKEHPVKNELERIRSYMTRIKEAQDAINKPRLDKKATSRFVKSALWQNSKKKTDGADSKQKQTSEQTTQPLGCTESSVSPHSRKRKCKSMHKGDKSMHRGDKSMHKGDKKAGDE